MRVLLLAAGYGTRLYPLTEKVPKALLKVKDATLLDCIIRKVTSLGDSVAVDATVLISNNKFYSDFVAWKERGNHKLEIINDGSNSPAEKLGAIGDIHFAVSKFPEDDWLIVGTDNFFDWELGDFTVYAQQHRPYVTVGVYKVKALPDASRFGVVELDAQGRIVEFIEKPPRPARTTVAVCIYFFPKESLGNLDVFLRQMETADAAGKYIEWLVTRTSVYGQIASGRWLDVGTRSALQEAEKIGEV